ncbi:hypothetical protein NIES3974_15720 [Calothrix sp. NIES-3974]|nr:hypothetical protein NIES3974_15720 [Calothrix sp. NIES-3974]
MTPGTNGFYHFSDIFLVDKFMSVFKLSLQKQHVITGKNLYSLFKIFVNLTAQIRILSRFIGRIQITNI